MLDGINPDGLTQLNWLAAVLLGTAVVALAIALVAGLVVFVSSRSAGSASGSGKGLRMVWGGVAGAVILGSLGGAVQWGSSLGTSSLMVEGARQQAVTVDRTAPKTTCRQQAVRDFDDEDPKLTFEQREQIVQEITQGKAEIGVGEQVVSVKWRAAGPDCSAENQTVAAGTQVEVRLYDTVAVGGSAEIVRTYEL